MEPHVGLFECLRSNSRERRNSGVESSAALVHGDLETWAAAGLLSQAGRRTTSCGNNGWLATDNERHLSSATGIRLLDLLDGHTVVYACRPTQGMSEVHFGFIGRKVAGAFVGYEPISDSLL